MVEARVSEKSEAPQERHVGSTACDRNSKLRRSDTDDMPLLRSSKFRIDLRCYQHVAPTELRPDLSLFVCQQPRVEIL
jgi:hypothetical protein